MTRRILPPLERAEFPGSPPVVWRLDPPILQKQFHGPVVGFAAFLGPIPLACLEQGFLHLLQILETAAGSAQYRHP
jgi:hypothetical protein